MNREIKFKFWNPTEKEWISNAMIEIDSKNGFFHLTGEEFIACQFTGLLDKTGKEIYEGDIVKYKFTTQDITDIGTDRVAYLPINCGFYPFTMINYCEDGYYSFLMEDIEVIGNIYETNGKD